MTICERLALDALSRVSFGMGGARRFVLDMLRQSDEYELSPRQKWNLGRLAWRYRRQLPREVSDWALEINAGMAGPPALKRGQRQKGERRTFSLSKYEGAREALKQPLQFGNLRQIEANRILRKKGVCA